MSLIAKTAEVALPRKVVQHWQETVEAHLADNPLTNDELANLEEAERKIVEQERLLIYGATLLGVLVTPRFVLYLQLGDGDILTVSDAGEVTRPLPPDDRQFANETLSLCSPGASGGKRLPSSGSAGAWTEFRIRFQPLERSAPALILVSTDGYANSFRSESDFLKVGSDLRKMIQEEGIGYVRRNLAEWLSEASQECSGDDVTLGLICRAHMAMPADAPAIDLEMISAPEGDKAKEPKDGGTDSAGQESESHEQAGRRSAYGGCGRSEARGRSVYRVFVFDFLDDRGEDIDMSELLKAGQTIHTDTGSTCQVERFLGGGG